MEWLKAHKGPLGGGILAIYVYLAANPLTDAKWWPPLVGVVGAFLVGGGFLKSDQYYKDRPPQ